MLAVARACPASVGLVIRPSPCKRFQAPLPAVISMLSRYDTPTLRFKCLTLHHNSESLSAPVFKNLRLVSQPYLFVVPCQIAMASGGPALSPSAKAAINLPQQSPFVSQSQAQLAILGSERQRRHGGGASGGSSTQSRAIPFPRSNQHLRKQHRTRKPPFEDEDSMAEANAIRSSSSRKGQTSITHLMKFALPPRLTSYHQPSHHRRTHRQAPFYWHVEKSRSVHA